MRRRDHERIVHEKDKTISRLERQNQELLDKLLYVTGNTWTPPPPQHEEDLGMPPEEIYSFAPEQTFDADPGIE